MNNKSIIEAIDKAAVPFDIEDPDLEQIVKLVGNKRIVLMGEASHGTHEFYELRAKITRKLIEEKGFNAVAIEGDWPDAYRVTRYLCGASDIESTDEALGGFQRFPAWMWRNTEVASFVNWARRHNDAIDNRIRKVKFYGLDLYSLHASMEAVIEYLTQVDPKGAEAAKARYRCFEPSGRNPEAYGFSAAKDLKFSCEKEVKEQLMELQRHAFEYVKKDGIIAEDEYFYAEQNARLVKDSEAYYRTLFLGEESSWNARDKHMAETLAILEKHLTSQLGEPSKIVIWAHNSHIGDAHATEMRKQGEVNIGQLAREHFKDSALLLGFLTYEGTVTAASHWGSYAECKNVRPALEESYEALFHEAKYKNFILNFQQEFEAKKLLTEARLERFIGVIYRPETERASHYYHADITNQFDAIIYLDKTRAVAALEINSEWEKGELPESYPSGL